jgi:hypothetical protein
MNRHTKILKISQAHLAPNMSLVKWCEILYRYPILGGRLDSLTDSDLDRITADIKRVVLFGGAADPPAGTDQHQKLRLRP